MVEPPQNDPTIIIEQIDRRMYLQQVPLGRGRRAVVDGMCFLHGDLDEKVCLQVDVSSQANPEMIFKMDGENSDVIIAKLPTKIADRIRDILTDIFSNDNKDFSLCLPRSFLRNAHGMRGAPPRDRMTTFGLRELREGGGASYINTVVNFFSARGNLHCYLREVEVLICEWIKSHYPEVLDGIQDDNSNYHGHCPSYIGEEEMISPRIVVSWQLGNEPHVDPKDNGLSVVVWVVALDGGSFSKICKRRRVKNSAMESLFNCFMAL